MLQAQEKRIAPTDRTYKLDPVNQYRKLMKKPKTQDIEEWIGLWETTYTKSKKNDLSDVQGSQVHYDFLDVI